VIPAREIGVVPARTGPVAATPTVACFVDEPDEVVPVGRVTVAEAAPGRWSCPAALNRWTTLGSATVFGTARECAKGCSAGTAGAAM
jgi:hypothetical protein